MQAFGAVTLLITLDPIFGSIGQSLCCSNEKYLLILHEMLQSFCMSGYDC